MAIKFVDIEHGDAGESKRLEKADALPARCEPDAEALEESVDPDDPDAPVRCSGGSRSHGLIDGLKTQVSAGHIS